MKSKPPATAGDPPSDLVLMNEALMLGALRQDELMEAVRTSETRYRRLFEESHDGVLLIHPVTRKITDANPSICQLLGHPREDVIGKELIEIGLLKSVRASREMFANLKKHHKVRYDHLALESGAGSHRGVEVVANLYQENGSFVIQCNVRDITERMKVENARRQLDVLTASNLKLNHELVRRQAIEDALRISKQHQERMLKESQKHQAQLRDMSHQILRAQEDERKRISRELHDVIAQALVGINVHVATLAQIDAGDAGSRRQKIARTHQLIEESVDLVHRFASELRPTMLDDLGLIPALHSYMKNFMEETGIRASLKSYAGIEKASGTVRTALFRVAQESLTNVARHAGATRVAVSIEDLKGSIRMKISDDGQGFDVEGADGAKESNRLGLLGMRERIEMLGGSFCVESEPGNSTAIHVEVKATDSGARKRAARKSSRDSTLECP
jgi:PAS domain S-box-containing protein